MVEISPPLGTMYTLGPRKRLSAEEMAAREAERQERIRVALEAAREETGGVWLMEWHDYEEGGAEGVFSSVDACIAYLNQRYSGRPEINDVVDGEFESRRDSRSFTFRRVRIRE